MPSGAWFALALVVIVFGLVYLVSRQSGKIAREEEEGKYDQRQAKAKQADQERADEIEERVKKATAAKPDAGSLSERLQSSGRGRRTTKD